MKLILIIHLTQCQKYGSFPHEINLNIITEIISVCAKSSRSRVYFTQKVLTVPCSGSHGRLLRDSAALDPEQVCVMLTAVVSFPWWQGCGGPWTRSREQGTCLASLCSLCSAELWAGLRGKPRVKH